MKHYILAAIAYWVIISIIGVFFTIKDKRAAIKNKWRVPEATLMIIGLLGGAAAMFITMKIIRHKTKRLKFMLGLPLETALHVLIIAACFYLDIL